MHTFIFERLSHDETVVSVALCLSLSCVSFMQSHTAPCMEKSFFAVLVHRTMTTMYLRVSTQHLAVWTQNDPAVGEYLR